MNDSLNKGKLSPHMIESEATMAELIGAARAGLANQGTMECSADLLAHLGVAAMKPYGKSDAADATVKDVRAHGRCLNRQIAWMLGPTHDAPRHSGPKRIDPEVMGAIVDALEREWKAGGERVIRWPDAYRCLQQTVLSGEQWAGQNVHNARKSVREQVCRHLAADASGSTLRISGSGGGASAQHCVWDLATGGRAAAAIWKAQDDAGKSTAAGPT